MAIGLDGHVLGGPQCAGCGSGSGRRLPSYMMKPSFVILDQGRFSDTGILLEVKAMTLRFLI